MKEETQELAEGEGALNVFFWRAGAETFLRSNASPIKSCTANEKYRPTNECFRRAAGAKNFELLFVGHDNFICWKKLCACAPMPRQKKTLLFYSVKAGVG